MMAGRECGMLILALCLLLSNVHTRFVDGQYADDEDITENEELVDRKKRYTEDQNRALSYCSGKCMYEERKTYGDCYDLCNWSGRSSPWAHLKRPSTSDENNIYQLANVLRKNNKAKDGVVKRAMDYINRDKRYTEDQNRAISYCAGLCMYNEKWTYGDCYDNCNWSGRGGSPWNKFNVPAKDESGEKMSKLMRTGSKGKGGDKHKVIGRSWSQY